jgi:NitT/TauT family transport system substrate-binding protein
MKKILALLLVAAVFILPFSACKKKDESGLTTVRLNEVTHSVFYAPLYLAITLGYFKEEGINLVLTNGAGADKVMTAVLSGSDDIGFCGPEAAIYVYNEGNNNYPKVFAQLTKRDGSFLFSRNEETNFKWSDLQGKEILAGRRGGVPAMTLEYVLNQNGLYDGTDVTLNYDVSFANMAAAFESGVADYTTLFEPTASTMVTAKKGYIVASVGEESGEVPYTAFIAKQSYLDNNANTVKSFLKAIYRAVKYMKENSLEIVAEKLSSQFQASTYTEILNSITNYFNIDAWMTNMSMTESSFNRLQDIMENAGELDKRASYTNLIDNTYANEVYELIF